MQCIVEIVYRNGAIGFSRFFSRWLDARMSCIRNVPPGRSAATISRSTTSGLA